VTPEPAAPLSGQDRFAFDPVEAVAHLTAADRKLAKIIERVGPFGMQLRDTPSLFLALAESIVYQQLNGRAAATIFGRVKALFADPQGDGLTAAGLLGMSDDKLRAAGLSRTKLLSLRDLAQRIQDGQLPELASLHSMTDANVVEILTQVRGIGRWTAEMLLIFRLGRPDILPVDDYGVRQGFAVTMGRQDVPTRQELADRGARWKPYSTVASWYLWRAAELRKKATRPKAQPAGRTAAASKKAAKKTARKKAAKKKAAART